MTVVEKPQFTGESSSSLITSPPIQEQVTLFEHAFTGEETHVVQAVTAFVNNGERSAEADAIPVWKTNILALTTSAWTGSLSTEQELQLATAIGILMEKLGNISMSAKAAQQANVINTRMIGIKNSPDPSAVGVTLTALNACMKE